MRAAEYALKASDIFVLSESFTRIQELVNDETATIDHIADVIIIDPALSGSVLKLANSSLFNYPGKIDTISKAVLILGITEVYTLVIAYFTTEAFKTINADIEFLDEFWEKSVDCALLVQFLGIKLKVPNAERLFLLGILHNIGELVVKQFLPDEIKFCQINRPSNLFIGKQKAIFDFTYAECSTELLKLWQLPFSLIEPVSEQDNNDFSTLSLESKLLYIAKRVMLRNLFFDDYSLEGFIKQDLFDDMNINDDLLEEAAVYCATERFEILNVLRPSSLTIL